MKRWSLWIVAAVAALLIGALGVGAVAAAGPGGPEGAGRGGPHGHGGRGLPGLQAVAELLGMTPRELLIELRDGDTTVAAIAADQGTSVDEVVDAALADHEARMAELVADGTLTQPQADFRTAEARERVTDMVTLPLPYGMAAEGLRTAAQTIGLSVDELIAGIEAGQTIAELAAANGSSTEAVVDALVAAKQAHFDEAVGLDLMTETQARLAIRRYREKATQIVENFDGQRPGGWGDFGRRGPGRPGFAPERSSDGQQSFAPRGAFGSALGAILTR